MAAEYKLKFTAEEIDNKLSKIEFDKMPTEGSENLVTSGAVHTALQSVGGTDLVAGDGIEIKDGVVRSTLGDFVGTETENKFVEFYRADNIEMYDQEDGTYVGGIGGELTSPIDTNEKLTMEFKLSDGSIKTFDVDLIFEYGEGEDEGVTFLLGFYNCVQGDDGLVKVDENSDALCFEGGMNEEVFELAFVTFEDYTGASVTISQGGIIERDVYVTLPENALTGGNLIKIENGVVNSLLGERVVSKKEVELCNIESIPSDNYDEEGDQTSYNGECSCVPTKGDKLNVEITLANSDVPIIFNDVEVKVDEGEIYIFANSNQTIEDVDSNGVEKIDESLPFVAVLFFEDEDEGLCYYHLMSFEDITGASVKVGGIVTEVEIVKLPNKALTFDSEPTEGSRNLVASDGIYKAINNAQFSFAYDSTPTQWSPNLMRSGDLYNAFNEVSTKIDNSEKGIVGKRSIFNGEIFNDYSNNWAQDYGHAEGQKTTASISAHAEGEETTAGGYRSHAEGYKTTASGNCSHAEGQETIADGINSHAEGYQTTASGVSSHVEGIGTIANGTEQHVQGRFNIKDIYNEYAHIVGNGNSNSDRSNAHTLDWNGNAWYAGTVKAKEIFTDDIFIRDGEIITELASASKAGVIGSNFLFGNQEYLVVYNGVEHRLGCRQGTTALLGDVDELGFKVSQDHLGNVILTTSESSCTFTISKIETLKTNLLDYVSSLEDRIAQLEAKLNS